MKKELKMNEEDWLAVWSREGERVKGAVHDVEDSVPSSPRPQRRLGTLEIADIALLAVCLAACVALVVVQGVTSQWSDRLVYRCVAAWLAAGVVVGAAMLAKGIGRRDRQIGVFRWQRYRGFTELSGWLTAALLLSSVAGLTVALAIPPRLEYAEAVTTGGSLAEKQALVDNLFMRTVL